MDDGSALRIYLMPANSGPPLCSTTIKTIRCQLGVGAYFPALRVPPDLFFLVFGLLFVVVCFGFSR